MGLFKGRKDNSMKPLGNTGNSKVDSKVDSKVKEEAKEFMKRLEVNLLTNIDEKNIAANILTYLGVGPVLANNPIVKERLISVILGNIHTYESDFEKLGEFIKNKRDIKTEIIDKLMENGSVFQQNSLQIASKYNGKQHIDLDISLGTDGIVIKDKRFLDETREEFYNASSVLVKRVTYNDYNGSVTTQKRDENNPFIMCVETYNGRRKQETFGLNSFNVVDMNNGKGSLYRQYGYESDEEFKERLVESTKREMEDFFSYRSNSRKYSVSAFLKYVGSRFPNLCKKYSNDARNI